MEYSTAYELFRNSGFKVFCSPSSEWYMIQPGMLMSIPYHRLISPPENELDLLLKESGALGLRYPTSVDNFGFISKLEICEHFGYDLEYLKHGPRGHVKTGMKNCEIRDVSIEELRFEGYQLNMQTFERQNRDDPKADIKYWHRLCDGLSKTSNIKILGSYCENKLAAYTVIIELPNMAEMILQNSDTAFLSYCPNNLLTYHVARHYLTERDKPLPVCYGLGSLEDTPGLDQYKSGMGFELRPIKQRIYFRKEIRFLLRPAVLHIAEFINRNITKKNNYRIDKGTALLKRYLEQK